MKKKQILIVIHDCSLAGTQLLALNLVKSLRINGYCVYVLCLDKGELYEDFRKYSRIFCSNSNSIINFIFKILKKLKVKHVLCNSVMTGDITKIAALNGMKVISLIHELPEFIKILNATEKAKILSEYSYKIVFPNHFVKDKFLSAYTVDSQKVIIRPQGLYLKKRKDYSTDREILEKKKMGFRPEDKIILCMGHGGTVKGVDLFYEVAKKVLSRELNIKFVWVGDLDKKYQYLYRIATRKGILFFPPTREVANYYRIADLYLLTSRVDSFPSTVLESLVYGIPVLGFDGAGGFTELSDKFVTLAKYCDCDDMANLTINILHDEEYINYVKKFGRSYINKNFNFDNYVKYLTSLF